MAKLQFKMPRQIDGVQYDKGVHTVEDSLLAHWYVLAGITNGVIVVVEGIKGNQSAPPPPPPADLKPPQVPQQPAAPQAPAAQTPAAPSGTSYPDLMNNGPQDQAPTQVGGQQPPQVPQQPAPESDEAKKNKRQEAAKKAAATRAANKAAAKTEGPAQ